MKTKYAITLLLSAIVSTAIAQDGPRYSHTGPTMITGVRVIDGLGGEPKENQDVVLIDGKIASIEVAGTHDAPNNALVIDGKGMTAMPGLIDAHVHIQGGWANGLIRGERYAVSYEDAKVQQRLSGYLYAGVTTVLDVGNDHDWVVKTRDKINSGELFGPRAFVCGGAWSQSPSGWDSGNTSDGFGLSTKVTSIAQIPEQMDRYVKDGIEIIKLYSGISPLAGQEVVKEAHKRDIRVVADFWGLNLNRGLMENIGLDGWAHSGAFIKVPAADHKWMADNNRFVIATANVGEKLAGARVKDEKGEQLMAKEPLIVDIWGKSDVADFYSVYPQIRREYYEGPESFYQKSNFGDLSGFRDTMLSNIKASYDAGVLIAGGTDDIYASLWPGESMHRELRLLVMAGIPELEAIKICTHNGAKVLRRDKEFGSLQKRMSADILLVEGNPAKNISDTRNVKHVFLRGKQVDRESLTLQE
jgi:imidazolonepropionase-like amidohydrolase